MDNKYFDRDISWLSFNERVLKEAAKDKIPLGDRLKFLSIYSSNLDEFYRVRIPALMALKKIKKEEEQAALLKKIGAIIDEQQQLFGQLLLSVFPPLKKDHDIELLYNQPLPSSIKKGLSYYFFTQVMAFLQPVFLSERKDFFPENNRIYFSVSLNLRGKQEIVILNIPSNYLTRFFSLRERGFQYIIFLDDIILDHLPDLFPDAEILHAHSFKITRDAALDLKDEYEGDLAEKIEQQLLKRNSGYATRFLYDGNMPEDELKKLIKKLKLKKANKMPGGRYHNLKDLSELPIPATSGLFYTEWTAIRPFVATSIFALMNQKDFMLHPPYQDYGTVLRFFNEAAIDHAVTEIYITVYRIANDSHIASALISAARNGKKVTVFVELKARFDEANNIRWAKKMKAAGVKIIYSIPGLKVHAKIALVKRRKKERVGYYGLLGTGNFNEATAKIYADHILFTTRKDLVRELELLFIFLGKRKKMRTNFDQIRFHHLLVSQFNLHKHFLHLIEDEIKEAQAGRPAAITLKINNLESESFIDKLYEASRAGVEIRLFVRSICRLIPGMKNQSEYIQVKRIVDRYLEHDRIFIFHHQGEELVFSGSSDWMNRSIKRRIEVCFPVFDKKIKEQLKTIISIDLKDNTQAVILNEQLQNIPVSKEGISIQAQHEIYKYLKKEEAK